MSEAKYLVRPFCGKLDALIFSCPGCKYDHGVNLTPEGPFINTQGKKDIWSWNKSFDVPTIRASVLIEGGRDKDGKILSPRCHSFITDGKIQFLTDCEHELSGHTVPLPDISEEVP